MTKDQATMILLVESTYQLLRHLDSEALLGLTPHKGYGAREPDIEINLPRAVYASVRYAMDERPHDPMMVRPAMYTDGSGRERMSGIALHDGRVLLKHPARETPRYDPY